MRVKCYSGRPILGSRCTPSLVTRNNGLVTDQLGSLFSNEEHANASPSPNAGRVRPAGSILHSGQSRGNAPSPKSYYHRSLDSDCIGAMGDGLGVHAATHGQPHTQNSTTFDNIHAIFALESRPSDSARLGDGDRYVGTCTQRARRTSNICECSLYCWTNSSGYMDTGRHASPDSAMNLMETRSTRLRYNRKSAF